MMALLVMKLGVLEFATEVAQTEKRAILNGTKKKQLTSWWLSLARGQTDMFLRQLGYDFNAVPDNYIDIPPVSMESVQKNCNLIHQVRTNESSLQIE